MGCVQDTWSYLSMPFTAFADMHWFVQLTIIVSVIAFVVGTGLLRAVYRIGLRFVPFIKVNLDDDPDTDTMGEIVGENVVGLVLLLTCPYTTPLLLAYLLGLWIKNHSRQLFRVIGDLCSGLLISIKERRVVRFMVALWKLGEKPE